MKTRKILIASMVFVAAVACMKVPASAQSTLQCDAEYIGLIDERGVDDFLQRYATDSGADGSPIIPNLGTVCLDSPGGSFAQALRLYELIEQSGAVTYIKKGSECNSACSIAFLGGSTWVGQGSTQHFRARILSLGGQLGFHAPFTSFEPNASFTADEGNKIFALAVEALAATNGIRLKNRWDGPVMNSFLYNGFISTPPEALFQIKTTSDAIFSGIEVRGLPFVDSVSYTAITRVCDTAVAMHILDSDPTLAEGGKQAHEIISIISNERERLQTENRSIDSSFAPHFNEFGRDVFGDTIPVWAVQGYPSNQNRNDEWACIVEIYGDRNFIETWSNAKDFLSAPTFRISLVRSSAALQPQSSIVSFLQDNTEQVFYRSELPNWAALPSDTSLGIN